MDYTHQLLNGHFDKLPERKIGVILVCIPQMFVQFGDDFRISIRLKMITLFNLNERE
jgi:hypothetical protein